MVIHKSLAITPIIGARPIIVDQFSIAIGTVI